MEASAQDVPSLSVDVVRLIVTRPPLPISEPQIAELTNLLVSRFQTVTRADDDRWYFTTANGNASVIVSRDRIQFSIEADMASDIVFKTLTSSLTNTLSALKITAPFPYGVYLQGTFNATGMDSSVAIRKASSIFDVLAGDDSQFIGGGFRTVFSIREQTYDCRLETLFVNNKRFFISLDTNSLARPAQSTNALEQDLREKYDFFVNSFVPLASEAMQSVR